MFPNPLYTGPRLRAAAGSAASASESRSEEDEGTKLLYELREFKPYLKQRLEYIYKSDRSLELSEEVADIRFYLLEVLSDSAADMTHGVERIRSFINKLHEMQYRNPLPSQKELNELSKKGNVETEGGEQVVFESSVESDAPPEPSWNLGSECGAAAKIRNKERSFRNWCIADTLRKADAEDGKEKETSHWWFESSPERTNDSEIFGSSTPGTTNGRFQSWNLGSESGAAAKIRSKERSSQNWCIADTLRKADAEVKETSHWWFESSPERTLDPEVFGSSAQGSRNGRLQSWNLGSECGAAAKIRSKERSFRNWAIADTLRKANAEDGKEKETSQLRSESSPERNLDPEVFGSSPHGTRNGRFQSASKKSVSFNLAEKSKPAAKLSTPFSQLKKRLEKECSGLFKLGDKNRAQNRIEIEENASEIVQADADSSVGPPPSPPKKEDNVLELVKQMLMSPRVNKRDSNRLLKNPEELKKYVEQLKSGIAARNEERPKNRNNVKKPARPPPTKAQPLPKPKDKRLSLQELHDALVNACSSSSETGSTVSSIATRSSTRKSASAAGKPANCVPKKSIPISSNLLKKSTGKQKLAAGPKKATPRKRIVAPLKSSESEAEEEEPKCSSSSEESVQKKAKLNDQTDEEQIKNEDKSRTRQAVEALRQENMLKNKKKKDSHKKPGLAETTKPTMKQRRRAFKSKVTKEGRTVVLPNDIYVNQGVGKINLGSEHEKSNLDLSSCKAEKQEAVDAEEDDGDAANDPYFQYAMASALVEIKMDCSNEEEVAGGDNQGAAANVIESTGTGSEYEDFNSDFPELQMVSVQGNYTAPAEDKETFPNTPHTSKSSNELEEDGEEVEPIRVVQVKEEFEVVNDDGSGNFD